MKNSIYFISNIFFFIIFALALSPLYNKLNLARLDVSNQLNYKSWAFIFGYFFLCIILALLTTIAWSTKSKKLQKKSKIKLDGKEKPSVNRVSEVIAPKKKVEKL